MGDTETPHFYDFGISVRVHEPQNHLCSSLETPGYLKKPRKSKIIFKHIILTNLKMLEVGNFENVGKGGHRQIVKIRLILFESLGYGVNISQKT